MKKAFVFSLPSTSGNIFDLKIIKENVVIYFYPKDDTPGCTLETRDTRGITLINYYKALLKMDLDSTLKIIKVR